jgi:calreticulin
MFALLFTVLAIASATTYFKDDFTDGEAWSKRWIQSTKKPEAERGALKLSAGKWATDEESEKGLQTSEDARFYHFTAKFPEFTNKDKTLVLQYSIKNEQSIDCGGMYLKLHPAGIDQANYDGDTDYNVMFGPDQCGSTRRVHFILNNGGKNHLVETNIDHELNQFTRTYTMILRPDNTAEVLIDGESKLSGNIEDHWKILPPKQINDPAVSKPADWEDRQQIEDPLDKKPDEWDSIPETIVDPDAKKPDDWDNELDGEWEAPTIANPAYKGVWRPKMIDNPAYKGPWVHPQVPNPDYKPDPTLYEYKSFGAVGLEIWQVKSGTVFDNILVTDSVEEAAAARKAYADRSANEKKNSEAQEKAAAAESADTDKDDDVKEAEDL